MDDNAFLPLQTLPIHSVRDRVFTWLAWAGAAVLYAVQTRQLYPQAYWECEQVLARHSVIARRVYFVLATTPRRSVQQVKAMLEQCDLEDGVVYHVQAIEVAFQELYASGLINRLHQPRMPMAVLLDNEEGA